MEVYEGNDWSELLEAESVEAGLENSFERLAGLEGPALSEAFSELAEVLSHEVCRSAELCQDLCSELRGVLREQAPEVGSFGEKVLGIAEVALGALEQGSEWLRTHPEATECAVRIGLLALLVTADPELADTLLDNPEQLSRYLDIGALVEAGMARAEQSE